MRNCVECKKPCKDFIRTAYGNFLCEPMWDEYILTEKGKVEYLIGICKGDYPASDFDADFLIDVSSSWRQFRDELDLFKDEIKSIESIASSMGLL